MTRIPTEKSSAITPESVYERRRDFLKNAALYAATSAAFGGGMLALIGGHARAGGSKAKAGPTPGASGPVSRNAEQASLPASFRVSRERSRFSTDEPETSEQDCTSYNNFYEFGLGKEDPAAYAGTLRTRPWVVSVEGLCKRSREIDVDSIISWFSLEERIYRMRCVEAWSMVVPWLGFPLAGLLSRLEPLPSARYVAFTTLHDPEQMPGQKRAVLPWPYVEGLRMDEAMHPLAFIAVGLYGKVLPNQNGAPLRLVVPWKYGFKGCKSIVKITFTDKEPATTWATAAPDEYGFHANVNPAVDHPRWSQATERRIGELWRRPTLPFNGYAELVQSLYAGMDLRRHF